MPKFQGQTDSVLKIKLPSALIDAHWGHEETAHGGRSVVEVTTQYVGDDSDIQVTLKDLEGGTIETLKGKILANHFRVPYTISKPNKTGGMFFEVELKAHGLKGVGPKLKVMPPVRFKDFKWFDEKGQKELTEVQDGETVLCQATVEGAPDGSVVDAVVSLRWGLHNSFQMLTPRVPVKDGKVRFSWTKPIPVDIHKIQIQSELDKHGGKYYPPEYIYALELWGVKTEAKPVKVVQALILRFEEWSGVAGIYEGKKVKITEPDGKVQEKTIPKDGVIPLKKTKPGRHKVDGEVLKELAEKQNAKTLRATINDQSSKAEDKGSGRQDKAIETKWKNSKRQNDFNELISKAAKKYDIEPLLLKALIWKESGFKPNAANNVGFAGLTQIGGQAIKEAKLNKGKTEKKNGKYVYDFEGDERFNPEKSIVGGALIFSHKRKTVERLIFSKFKKQPSYFEKQKFFLGAYNGGEGTIHKAWKNYGSIDCLWHDLMTGTTGDPIKNSPLYKAIPTSWGPEEKHKEISNYPLLILEKKDS